MSNITPFPPPRLLSANLKKDLVDISTNASNNDGVSSTVAYSGDRGWDNSVLEGDSCASEEGMPQSSVEGNEEAMSRTIIEIETQSSSSSTTGSISGDDTAAKPAIVAFWLQRKLDHQSRSRDLVVRLGYRLRRKNTIKNDTKRIKTGEDHVDDRGWELDRDAEGRLILVRVHISHNDVFAVNQSQSQSMWLKSQLNELSALQMIATQNYSSSSQMALQAAHVVGTSLIAKDEENGKIYTILPYHRDGTLLQFCQSMGNLEESLARFIFRQIVQGLKTLKNSGLCHRNLSLDTIALDGDHVDIIGLGWALRCAEATQGISQDSNDDGDNEAPQFLPTPGGSDPRFIAPESFHFQSRIEEGSGDDDASANRDWNGFRDDLWATGLILYSMVVGTEALFTAPFAGDKIFARLCIKGDIRGETKRFGKRLGKDYSNLLSDDLVNLLQSMLSADPKQRLVLEEVMKHPWMTNDDPTMTPTQCTAAGLYHPMAP